MVLRRIKAIQKRSIVWIRSLWLLVKRWSTLKRIQAILSLSAIGAGIGFIYWPLALISVGLLLWVDLIWGVIKNERH